jgi:hypothetical protein
VAVYCSELQAMREYENDDARQRADLCAIGHLLFSLDSSTEGPGRNFVQKSANFLNLTSSILPFGQLGLSANRSKPSGDVHIVILRMGLAVSS